MRAVNRSDKTCKPKRRGGAVTLEAILCIPVLVIAFFAVAEFGILLLVQKTVTAAAIKGARESAKGASFMDVKADVNAVLAVHAMFPIIIGDANIRMERKIGAAPTVVEPMPATCTPSFTAPALGDDQTRVTLCVPLPAGPIKNFLKTFGFDLMGKSFNISAYADLE